MYYSFIIERLCLVGAMLSVFSVFKQAGIDTHRLCLALEPEAASLICRYLRMNVQRGLEQKSDVMMTFTPGTKYLVLDAGGKILSLYILSD